MSAHAAWKVIPIRPGGKAPAIKDWQTRAKPIGEWNGEATGRWGAPTGPGNGFWILDVDPRHGGTESLEQLVKRFGPLGVTRIVRTPSGGLHLYFQWEQACALLTNTAGKLGAGLDIRVDGGQVLVPPTEGYVVESDAPVAPAPAWLLSLLLPPVKSAAEPQASGGKSPSATPWRTRRAPSQPPLRKSGTLPTAHATRR